MIISLSLTPSQIHVDVTGRNHQLNTSVVVCLHGHIPPVKLPVGQPSDFHWNTALGDSSIKVLFMLSVTVLERRC